MDQEGMRLMVRLVRRLSRLVMLVYDFHCFEPVLWYGDGAGNTVENYSFS